MRPGILDRHHMVSNGAGVTTDAARHRRRRFGRLRAVDSVDRGPRAPPHSCRPCRCRRCLHSTKCRLHRPCPSLPTLPLAAKVRGCAAASSPEHATSGRRNTDEREPKKLTGCERRISFEEGKRARGLAAVEAVARRVDAERPQNRQVRPRQVAAFFANVPAGFERCRPLCRP